MTEQQLLEIKEQLKKEILSELYELPELYELKQRFKQQEGTKQKQRTNCPSKVKIKCLSDGKIFESIKECAKFYKITRQKIYDNIPKKFIRVGEIIPVDLSHK